MAAYNNPGPAKDDSFADAEMPEGMAAGAKEPAEGESGETALLPKSILGGKEFKPGEEVVLKVVNVHDDQVEVAYATGESKEESPPAAAPAAAPDEMASMME